MVGGAEKSTYEILKHEHRKGHPIELVSFDGVKTLNASNNRIAFNKEWKLSYIGDIKLFSRFSYYEYLWNRKRLNSYFRELDKDSVLYAYGIYAPIAINSFLGSSVIFIRSETDLAINANYHTGWKRIAKYLYILVELPAFWVYKNDLRKAIGSSRVVCNSKYMSRKLSESYNKNGDVMYPFINKIHLQNEFKEVDKHNLEKGIVFVGDSVMKGTEIARAIAEKMPAYTFFFFSRYVESETRIDNVVWMPWQKKEVDIYKRARIVIVPSVCQEAYGRVSREAHLLRIPVLVSNIGGLPETVDENIDFIVENYLSVDSWVEKIKNLYTYQN